MSSQLLCALFAQATGGGLPVGKAVGMIVFFGGVAAVSTFGLFAPRQTLASMSGVIGTKNPHAARAVCGFAALVGYLMVLTAVLSLTGNLRIAP